MHQLTRPEPTCTITEQQIWHGRPIADLADFDFNKRYIHVLAKDSPSMDEAILEGRAVRGLCGRTWTPQVTDCLSTGGGGPVASWCPVCVAIWNASGGTR